MKKPKTPTYKVIVTFYNGKVEHFYGVSHVETTIADNFLHIRMEESSVAFNYNDIHSYYAEVEQCTQKEKEIIL